ncbi:MAG: RNA polymerase sigma factor [Cytophagales bacterium]|nr:RNA polymerase sigma factor [Cytophagales bacterium]
MTRKEFKQLYQTNVRCIRNYLYYRSGNPSAADEITQETFVRVWEKQFDYDPKKTKSLLYKIANQLFLDSVRQYRLAEEHADELSFRLKEGMEHNEPNAMMLKKCEQALAALTENERVVFLMSRKDGMKYRDIADCLEISVKAVEKRMSQALKKLAIEKTWKIATSQ